MTGTVQIVLISFLLQGAICNWEVNMPEKVEGLGGSCVLIPCTFTLPSGWESLLDNSCKAIWKQGNWIRTQVFDSSLTGADITFNLLQGSLLGDLSKKNCTTVFNNVPPKNDYFWFRLECSNALKFNFQPSVILNVQESLPRPTIMPSSLEVEEGIPMNMSCWAAAPCPSKPPILTWTPVMGDLVGVLSSTGVTSVMNFTSSHINNGQKISCRARYSRQDGNSDVVNERTVTLRVLYAPTNTSIDYVSPVKEKSWVTLTCNSDANPAVISYSWYNTDEGQQGMVGSSKWLYTNIFEGKRHFYCKASNRYGSQNSSIIQIDVQFPPKETTVTSDPSELILEGSSISLHCNSRANPPITNFTWYKDDVVVEESGKTLFINHTDPTHSGNYYCTAKNSLGEESSAAINIDIQYPPKSTSLSADPSGPVPDGTNVTLTCTSIANPAELNFTWYRVSGKDAQPIGSSQEITFNVRKLSEDQYYCEAQNVHGSQTSEPVKINVTFSPEILPSSRCVNNLSQMRCSCDSQGNPPPSLVWEVDGQRINDSTNLSITEVPLGEMGIRTVLTLQELEVVSSLVCLSFNLLGSDTFAYNLTFSGTPPGARSVLLMVSTALGLLGILLLLVPLLFVIFRKKTSSSGGAVDTSDLLPQNQIKDLEVDAIYANKSIIDQEQQLPEDQLHYANVDFVKLRAQLGSDFEEGAIIGQESRTEQYAEIRLHSGDCNGGEDDQTAPVAETGINSEVPADPQ